MIHCNSNCLSTFPYEWEVLKRDSVYTWRWSGQVCNTANKFGSMYSQNRNCAASVPISTFMCLWAIYIFPHSAHLFSCSRIGRPIMGIYKLLTETGSRNWGLRPRSFISGNFGFEFSVYCLCSVVRYCRTFILTILVCKVHFISM